MKQVMREMKRGAYRTFSEKTPKVTYPLLMTEAEKQELYDLSVKMGCTMANVIRMGLDLVKEREANS
jgi:hypothetical protein